MPASSRSRLLTGSSIGILALALAGLHPALAADATAAQATSMENQVRDALGTLFGPAVKLGDRPIQITAAGDHYDIALPFPNAKLRTPAGGIQTIQMTGTARPGDNGTWIIENVKITNPLMFTVDMPLPQDAPGAPAKTTPVTYTMDQQGQSGRILWDPSFATPSTWTTTTQSINVKSDGGPVATTTASGPVNAVTTMRPAGSGNVDILVDGTLQDYRVDAQGPQGPLQVAMKTVRVTSGLNGISRARGLAMVQAMSGLIASAVTAPPAPGQMPKAAPELVKAVVASLQDFASDFMLDESFDGFIVKAQGQTAALDHMRLGLDARSDAGLLRAGMTLGMQGLTLPDMPLGDMAGLIPRRVALRPVVGGVAVADIVALANLASENKSPPPELIAALFSHGGITGGIESMTVEVGGATFTAQGKVVATAPDPGALTGTATITAENFDGLMQKVTAIPSLAQQAVPVMVFIKGIGRTVDNKLVWDIVYKENKVLINNVDLTAMAGGGGSAAPAPPQVAPPQVAPPVTAGPKGATKRPIPSWAK
jgi:hypothetical protein